MSSQSQSQSRSRSRPMPRPSYSDADANSYEAKTESPGVYYGSTPAPDTGDLVEYGDDPIYESVNPNVSDYEL